MKDDDDWGKPNELIEKLSLHFTNHMLASEGYIQIFSSIPDFLRFYIFICICIRDGYVDTLFLCLMKECFLNF